MATNMQKHLLTFSFILFSLAGYSQWTKFYLSNDLKLLNKQNDTIAAPFTGGMLNPQVGMMDLNNDQIKDLVIFDKNGAKITTYLNRGTAGQSDFIHAPRFEAAFPKLFSWMYLADYNCDGKEDIFTSVLGGVKVYKNTSSNGNLSFELISDYMVDVDNIGLYCFFDDYPAFEDIDKDGDLDFLAFDVFGTNVWLYRNERVELGLPCDTLVFKWVDGCWGAFAEAESSRNLALGQACPWYKFYKNEEGPKTPRVQTGPSKHVGSTLMLFDSDADNDFDMLLGDITYSEMTFLKNGKSDFTYPYDTMIVSDTIFPRNTTKINVPSFPVAFYYDINNDNKKDLLVAPNDKNQGKSINQLWMYPNAGASNNPNFQTPVRGFLNDIILDFGSRTVPYFFDSDGDGDLDLILSAQGENLSFQKSRDRLILFENRPSNNKPFYHLTDTNWLDFMSQEIADLSPVFADINGDGLKDLIIGERTGKIRYYRNSGSATLPSFTLENAEAWGIDVGNSATPSVLDFNDDGLLDLLIGCEAGTLKFFQNTGSTNAPQFSNVPTINNAGQVNVAEWNWGNFDYDPVTGEPIDSSRVFSPTGHSAPFAFDLNDNDTIDLIIGSQQGQIFVFFDVTNLQDSLIAADTIFFSELNQRGFNYSLGGNCYPYVGFFFNDTVPSLLSGSLRGGLMFFEGKAPKSSDGGNLSISKPIPLNVNVYPNPASNQIQIERNLLQFEGEVSFEIIDVLGKTLLQGSIPQGETGVNLALNNFNNGIYFIKLNASSKYNSVVKFTVIN